jgi:glycerophosphoryl diester phosphodiesterase
MLNEILGDLRRCWKSLMLTDLICKIAAVILLMPLVTLPLQAAMLISRTTVLADQDILHFFLSPPGVVCLIGMGALWIGVAALELTALLAILADRRPAGGRPLSAIRLAWTLKWPVLQVTARITVWLLLVTAPFAVAAGLVYGWLLSGHDINFYLQQRPPEFLAAVGIAVVLVTGWLVVVTWMIANWLFALAVIVFHPVRPAQVLRESRQRVAGYRRQVLLWIAGWLLLTTALSTLANAAVVAAGRAVIPGLQPSLSLLVAAIGVALLLAFSVTLVIHLLGQSLFAIGYFHLYQRIAGPVTAPPGLAARPEPTVSDRAALRLTRGRLLLAMVAGLGVVALLGWQFAGSVRLQDDVQVIAHRGSSEKAPENTLAAIRQAIDDGAEWVEIDVQETADGEVVVFHDSDFMKLAGQPLKIWQATKQDLQTLDIGSWFDPSFRDERVPTLAEALRLCRGKIRVLIELKYYGHDVALEQRVADVVEAAGMEAEIELMSLKAAAITKMKNLRPDWKVGWLMSVTAGSLAASEADFLAANASFVDRAFIRAAHRRGQQVRVWTVNDPVSMSNMIGRGVDGLITDLPDVARSVLQQRAALTVPQRLLLELADVFGVETAIDAQ